MTAARDTSDPVPARRRLAGELRRARVAAGFGLPEAAAQLGWSSDAIRVLEHAVCGARVDALTALAALYEVTPDERDQWCALATGSMMPYPFSELTSFLPVGLLNFAALEAAAATIDHYAPAWVPELLRSAEVTRTVMSNYPPPGTSAPWRFHRALLNIARMAAHGDNPDKPHRRFVINEAAIGAHGGGTRLSKQQRAHLEQQDRDEPRTSIHLVPRRLIAALGFPTGFTVLQFAQPHEPVVYLHHSHHNAVEERADPIPFVTALDALQAATADPTRHGAAVDAFRHLKTHLASADAGTAT